MWNFFLNLIWGYREFGSRSPMWPKVEKEHLKFHPTCAVCGQKGKLLNPLNVHHVEMYSKHPELELSPENLLTLCRKDHFLFGHLNNWKRSNPTVREDAVEWYRKIHD